MFSLSWVRELRFLFNTSPAVDNRLSTGTDEALVPRYIYRHWWSTSTQVHRRQLTRSGNDGEFSFSSRIKVDYLDIQIIHSLANFRSVVGHLQIRLAVVIIFSVGDRLAEFSFQLRFGELRFFGGGGGLIRRLTVYSLYSLALAIGLLWHWAMLSYSNPSH